MTIGNMSSSSFISWHLAVEMRRRVVVMSAGAPLRSNDRWMELPHDGEKASLVGPMENFAHGGMSNSEVKRPQFILKQNTNVDGKST